MRAVAKCKTTGCAPLFFSSNTLLQIRTIYQFLLRQELTVEVYPSALRNIPSKVAKIMICFAEITLS